MHNDRPIESKDIRQALAACDAILAKHGLAGAVFVIGPAEAAWRYRLHATWSAIMADASAPMGFRIRAKSAEEGNELTHRKIEGAMHTICTLHDFASQTEMWMEELMRICRDAGIDFTHTPHGGQPTPRLTTGSPEDREALE